MKPDNKLNINSVASVVRSANGNEELAFLTGCLFAAASNSQQAEDFSEIPYRLQNALTALKRNRNIHITRSDKTNQIVILNKDVYSEKMNELLSDPETYVQLRTNPLKNKTISVNGVINRVFQRDDNLRNALKQVNPSNAYAYGLPKTTKPNVPLRPIIANINTPTYKLAKWLSKLLSPALGKVSGSHIINNVDFVEKVKQVNLNGGKMVSFDVDSLFTKVPVDETLQFLERKLPELNLDLPVSNEDFIKLIRVCVDDNVFCYDDSFIGKTMV
jgi:hypothetical protein